MRYARFAFFPLLLFFTLAALVLLNPKILPFSIGDFILKSLSSRLEEPVRLIFVGDVMLGRYVETLMEENGSSYPFSRLSLSTANSYLIGNFEASIPSVHKKTPVRGLDLSVDKDLLAGAEQFGFTHFSLANNHTFDFEQSGLENTRLVLEGLSIVPFGDPKNSPTSSFTIVESDDKSVALIGLHAVDKNPDSDALKKIFSEVNKQSEVQIAYVHWGIEYDTSHSAMQEELSRTLVDLGVDLIIGHHPHVIQDVQFVDDVPVFYSLGNFIFDQYFDEEVQESLVVKVDVYKDYIEVSTSALTSVDLESAPRLVHENELQDFLLKYSEIGENNAISYVLQNTVTVAN